MTDRQYRVILGVLLLFTLYFDLRGMLYALIGLLYLEGVTNLRVPFLVNRAFGRPVRYEGVSLPLETEQALRLAIATFLLLAGVVYSNTIWFLPWFLGFAILGAGLSDVCPVVALLRRAGCRN